MLVNLSAKTRLERPFLTRFSIVKSKLQNQCIAFPRIIIVIGVDFTPPFQKIDLYFPQGQHSQNFSRYMKVPFKLWLGD